MLVRVYSTLDVKAVNEEQRILEGVASTPATDRMDDIVEPMGAKFSLPLPFLKGHDSRLPIGQVISAKPNKAGIPIRVQIQRTDTPGELKSRLDTAWEEIKLGLVRGLSIGFRALESSEIEGSWGRRFTSWELLEVSAVVIPANQEASITAIKSFDDVARAATGSAPASSEGPRPALGHRVVRYHAHNRTGWKMP